MASPEDRVFQRMSYRQRKIVQAWLETPTEGIIELARDWRESTSPDLALDGDLRFASLTRVPDYQFGKANGFFIDRRGRIHFFIELDAYPEIDPLVDRVFLAGDFNGWQQAVGNGDWELFPASLNGVLVMIWGGEASRFLSLSSPQRFKFVTQHPRWLAVPPSAPNATRDDAGNVNRFIDPERTGHHLFSFSLAEPLDLSRSHRVSWLSGAGGDFAPLRPDGAFFALRSDLPLGAIVAGEETIFRLFAPRASSVTLCVCATLDREREPHRYALVRRLESIAPRQTCPVSAHEVPIRDTDSKPTDDTWKGVWEVTLDHNLHGWYYWYHIQGPSDLFGHFSPEQRILDPYALAAVSRDGPGIILDKTWIGKAERGFRTPDWQDLVIAEAHVRDLVMAAPIPLSRAERLGFSGLRRWVESPSFYLHALGVNAVELQPIQEFDAVSRDEYHWGYMPNNWFAPASVYSLSPAEASGVHEFQKLVAAFHDRGIAVIVDVVYNHVGVPGHLLFIDKHYYFETDRQGQLSNWSGCGNDYRVRSAMAKRLIIDSCVHLIEAYGIDGFRFDLAELLGVDTLREVEHALKTAKRDVILIAEPWSYRGHIAGELADTGWSSWNDGYRNFARDYIRGAGDASQALYFLKGSPWYFARWPAQTINYTESHDDRTWIDTITERSDGNGQHPTMLDRRRTHLMGAMLFASLGIPMLSAGQDFLRSKQGVNNTYLRGDLNGIDYRRLHHFSGTHDYFASWIAFRLGKHGRLLRQWSLPSEGFFRSFTSGSHPAVALLYNADGMQGAERLLFVINPTESIAVLELDEAVTALHWIQVADHERFNDYGVRGMTLPVEADLVCPPLSCALWLGGEIS